MARVGQRPRASTGTELPDAAPARGVSRPSARAPIAETTIGAIETRAIMPRVTFPDLASKTRSFERTLGDVKGEGSQQNLVLVSPETQAHVVLEAYPKHAAKRMVAIVQPHENIAGGFWWTSAGGITNLAGSKPELIRDGGLTGTKVGITANKTGSFSFEMPILDSARCHRDRATLGHDDRTALRERMQARCGLPEGSIRTRIVAQSASRVVFERESIGRRMDGAPDHTHRMIVEAGAGTTLTVSADNEVRVTSAGKPRISVAYLSDVPPATPFAPLELLSDVARQAILVDIERAKTGQLPPHETASLGGAIRALEDLSSLVFKEKALAGGWRFLTYFGRDTLQTLQMLMPLLDGEVAEGILQAALERLGEDGKVAHEESNKDQAAHERLEHIAKHGGTLDLTKAEERICDRKMVDDDFMLVSTLHDYVMSPTLDAARRDAFLERNRARIGDVVRQMSERGAASNADDVKKSLGFITRKAKGFAEDPSDPTKLVRFMTGMPVGSWRDSEVGEAGGVFSSSIDLELVPSALEKGAALARFMDMPSASLERYAAVWRTHARDIFTIKLTQDEMRERLAWFMKELATDDERAFFGSRTIEPYVHVDDFIAGSPLTGRFKDGISYPAISLDAKGGRIPVMSSDGLFGLLGAKPRPDAVRSICELLTLPYPLGLATEAGILITNAALAKDAHIYDMMGPGRYHGTLVWTWLQALGIAALSHQAKVLDAAGYKDEAAIARDTVRIIKKLAAKAGPLQTNELYGYGFDKGEIVAKALVGKENEPYDSWPGNATQLWATALPMLVWADARRLL